MEDLSPSDLKTILHSKRANMYYLEHCRVMQKDGRVLYLTEAKLTKQLYKIAARHTNRANFVRKHEATDRANSFLNHGNDLAYGLAASTLWVLGIPHGFTVMHGKTRRGALVFDIADLVKDALVLPWAFICAKNATTATNDKIYQFAHYTLDVIISVGYRMRSTRGTQFRVWAISVLKDHLIKG